MIDKELQKIADLFFNFFEPVLSAAERPSAAQALMLELGYIPPEEFKVFEKLRASTNAIQDIFTFIEGITEGDIDEDPELIVNTIKDLIEGILPLIDDLIDIPSFFQSELSGAGLLDQTNILTEFTRKLIDFLIIKHLKENHYKPYSLLRLFSIIEVNEIQEVSNEFNFPHLERIFHWERIGNIFTDPVGLLKTTLKDQDKYFYYQTMYALQELGNSLGLIPHYRDPELDVLRFINNNPSIENWTGFEELEILRFPLIPDDLDSLGIDVYPLIDTVTDKFIGLVLGLGIDPEQMEYAISDKFILQLKLSANVNKGLGFSIDQNDEFKFIADLFGSPQNLSDNTQMGFKAKLIGADHIEEDEDKLFSIGTSGGNRFEIGSFNLSFGIEKKQYVRLYIETELLNGLIAINFSEADGFISKIIGEGIVSNFNLGIGFSNRQGLYFTGSSGLEIVLPTHVNLGLIEIQNLLIGVFSRDEKIVFEIGSTFSANLGPLIITVENIGISFPDQRNSNFETIIPNFGFKPPSGVGLSIDAGAVKGGGYLYFDPDREEYAGALELVFSEWIALKAIGLITTKMPDGSDGFSLLVIITVEFGTGIQLGFGFTLLGVGGLLGLNRTVNIDAFKEGVRSGAVESVMFPEDVIANAPRIISDLRRFFPPRQDIFLVGPMAKIGWGTPTLVSAQLGVILEFPSVNITIVGVIKVALPDEDAEVLRLQVNFIGRVEPSNKLLWLYAELYDSRVLFITLEGSFGLLVNWGDNTNFVISAGGFHPKYTPPPLPFPTPQRITASILNESNAKVHIKGYFAVTSNSVQFGAKAELFFGKSKFNVKGDLTFDALFQFDPFYFVFSLSTNLSVTVFGKGLFTVGFSGFLKGPTPWHIKGKGKIGTWIFSLKVPFEHTWGGNQDTRLDPIEVYPLLEKEFNALTNWEARLPESSNILVSLRKLGESASDQLVLHPVGKLRISQRKVPVNFKLDKVGNQRPSDFDRLDVDATLPGSGSLSISKVEEKFAIGQFKDLDETDKMSSPAFEPLESGIEIAVAGEQMKTSQAVRRVIRYETIIIDTNFNRHVKTFFDFFIKGYAVLNNILFSHFLKGSSVSQSVLSNQYKKRMRPFDDVIKVEPNQYSVAFNTDNRPMDAAATTFTSQAKAMEFMEQQVKVNSQLADRLHVIPNTEINIAV
jgi:hypothetical protein